MESRDWLDDFDDGGTVCLMFASVGGAVGIRNYWGIVKIRLLLGITGRLLKPLGLLKLDCDYMVYVYYYIIIYRLSKSF